MKKENTWKNIKCKKGISEFIFILSCIEMEMVESCHPRTWHILPSVISTPCSFFSLGSCTIILNSTPPMGYRFRHYGAFVNATRVLCIVCGHACLLLSMCMLFLWSYSIIGKSTYFSYMCLSSLASMVLLLSLSTTITDYWVNVF